jgi:hypothetical protein
MNLYAWFLFLLPSSAVVRALKKHTCSLFFLSFCLSKKKQKRHPTSITARWREAALCGSVQGDLRFGFSMLSLDRFEFFK